MKRNVLLLKFCDVCIFTTVILNIAIRHCKLQLIDIFSEDRSFLLNIYLIIDVSKRAKPCDKKYYSLLLEGSLCNTLCFSDFKYNKKRGYSY